MGEQRQDRLASLDGLRGIAAVVVLFHHAFLVVPGLAAAYFSLDVPDSLLWLAYSPAHVLWAGGEAVYVFFILSGLVLTIPVMRRGGRWLSYYPSRLVRLYVPVVASVAIAATLAFIVPRDTATSSSPWVDMHMQDLTFYSIAKNALLVFGTDSLNSPLWSLRLEILFSLLLPAYVFVAIKFRKLWWLWVLGSVALSTYGAATDRITLVGLPLFAIGCVLATQLPRLREWANVTTRQGLAFGGIAFLSIIGLTATWSTGGIDGPLATIVHPIVVLSATALVALSSIWGRARSLLQTDLLQWLGKVSFSLYLVHEPIVVTLALALPTRMSSVVPPVAIAASLVAAALFFRFVERPSHDLSKRAGKLFSPRTTAEVTP